MFSGKCSHACLVGGAEHVVMLAHDMCGHVRIVFLLNKLFVCASLVARFWRCHRFACECVFNLLGVQCQFVAFGVVFSFELLDVVVA